jgi:hypothetical protein
LADHPECSQPEQTRRRDRRQVLRAPGQPPSEPRAEVESSIGTRQADILLLEKDLGVLDDGVMEGRRIFANTLKYVLILRLMIPANTSCESSVYPLRAAVGRGMLRA